MPPSPLAPLVGKLEQHSALAEADRRAIEALPATVRRLDPHAYIIREGDPPAQCAVLLSGFAYRQKLTGDGARQIVSLHIPGDPLDLQNLFLNESDHNVQTLSRAEVAFIPRETLQRLWQERPSVARAMLIESLIEASIFREWVLNIGRRDARARLSHLLCEFATRLDASGLIEEYAYELPLTQEQLGDATGLTPVHVNRTLKALEGEGLITRNRRRIHFPDWKRLREVADFNQRYLHIGRQGAAPANMTLMEA